MTLLEQKRKEARALADELRPRVEAFERPPVVISLCDTSTVMLKLWARAGFENYSVDLANKVRSDQFLQDGSRRTYGDVRTWAPPAGARDRVVFTAAFPPCTHVCCTGAQDFKKKGTGLLRDSLEMFTSAITHGEWSGAPFMVENPKGVLSTHVRKPDLQFHPWWYGDLWTKETNLWTGNGFIMPDAWIPEDEKPEDMKSKVQQLPDSKGRKQEREKTPEGFSIAVFLSNVNYALDLHSMRN